MDSCELDAKPATPALRALEAEVRRQLALLDYPAKLWVPPRPAAADGTPVHDVVVVGAGQAGLAVAFGLLRDRVPNILVIDRAPAGAEGPWVTYARMITLRSPKHLTGPDLGVPALTPRAWYEAVYGSAAWDAVERIPRAQWMAYLTWFRRTLDLPVRNRVALTGIAPAPGDLLSLAIEEEGRPRTLLARKLVLATGLEGGGAPAIPDCLDPALPRARWHHAMEMIDFAALAGRRIGVLGHGAAAFDNAATALEAGAASVDLFFRRPKLPRVNPNRWAEKTGFLRHFADMPDDLRWRFLRHIDVVDQPPPPDTYARCMALPGFAIHAATPWERVARDGDGVRVETPRGAHRFDHVILGTGVTVDPAQRPELASFADAILCWRDRYTPPPDEAHAGLGRYPYLGPGFELLEKAAGRAPWLRHIHYFTFGSTLSMGLSGASISGMRFAIARLIAGITRGLYLDDADAHYRSLTRFDEPDLALPEDADH